MSEFIVPIIEGVACIVIILGAAIVDCIRSRR